MGKDYKKYLALILSAALILQSQVLTVSAASSDLELESEVFETIGEEPAEGGETGTTVAGNDDESAPTENVGAENGEPDNGQGEQGLFIVPDSDDNPNEALGEPIGDDGSIGESAPEGDAEEGLLDDPEKELEDELGKDLEEKLEGELKEDLDGKTEDGTEGEEKIVLRAGAAAKSSKDFEIEDGVLVKYTGKQTNVVIPDGVTEIGEKAFFENKNIESVSIPDSVEIIGSSAFFKCENLQYVKFGKVKKIGNHAFCYCNRLYSISLPDGLEEIGHYAFNDCYGILELNIPDSVQEIGDDAFSGCYQIGKIDIPDSVCEIGYNAFEDYDRKSKPVEVKLPNRTSFKNMVRKVFSGRTISRVTIPQSIFLYGDHVFYQFAKKSEFFDETHIQQMFIEDGIEMIPDFFNWTIDNIYVPESVKEIDSLSSETIIHGKTGSYAQSYAKRNGNPYFNNEMSVGVDETSNVITGKPKDEYAWNSDNTAVAIVNSIGDVYGVSEGTCTISAKYYDGRDVGSCVVTVTKSTMHTVESIDDFQSPHDYENGGVFIWEYTDPEADQLAVTFSGQTEVEEEADRIFISSGDNSKIDYYTGKELAGRTIIVPSGTVRVGIEANDSVTAYGFKVEDVKRINLQDFVIRDGVFCNYKGTDKIVAIPYGVVEIGKDAFGTEIRPGMTIGIFPQVRGVIIPDSVTTIRSGAFETCRSLSYVDFGKVRTIGERAFYHCSSLSEIVLPEVLVEIGAEAFLDCSGLKKIYLPDSLKKIGDRAFASSSRTPVEIKIPKYLLELGENVFEGRTLSKLTMPKSFRAIVKQNTFASVHIQQLVYEAGANTIHSIYYDVDHIFIPEEVDYISWKWGEDFPNSLIVHAKPGSYGQAFAKDKDYAFFMKELTVKINSSISVLEGGSPNANDIWESDNESVATVDENGVVTGVSGGTCTVYVKTKEGAEIDSCVVTVTSVFEIQDGVLISYSGTGEEAVIPDGVTVIAAGAFKDCDKITRMYIPESVEKIEDGAFNGCSIDHIYVPEEVKEIGSLPAETMIHGKIGSIANQYAKEHNNRFFNSELTVEAGSTITVINGGSSEGEFIWESDDETIATVDETGVVTGVSKGTCTVNAKSSDGTVIDSCVVSVDERIIETFEIKDGVLVKYNGTDVDIVIPDEVIEIGEAVFKGNSDIKTITLPESVKVIDKEAFYQCYKLEKINLENVEKIRGYAFTDCYELEDVDLGKVVEIGEGGFCACTKFKHITLKNVEKIEKRVFDQCDLLEDIDLGKAVEIGENAFSRCYSLRHINLENIVVIGEWAFRSCSSLKDIELSDSLEKIGNGAFLGCENISKVTIPKGTVCEGNVFNMAKIRQLYFEEGTEEIPFMMLSFSEIKHIYIPKSVTSIGHIPEGATIHGETGSFAQMHARHLNFRFFNSELSVEAGSTISVIDGDSSEDEFLWETENKAIATVDTRGVVSGVSAGACKISAKTADGTVIGTCVINVTGNARIVAISELTISQIPAQEYIGGEIQPKPEVKDGETALEEGKHYTLTYASNKAVGTGYVTITGVPENGYEGTKKISFKIKAFDIAKNESERFVVSYEDTVEYSVKGAKPKVSISFINADGTTKRLKEGTDYTVSYKNNKNYSSQVKPTIVITAKGSYTGKKELQFKLKERDISKACMVATNMLWLGWPDTYCTLTVITDSGYILLPGIDYASLKYVYANKTVVQVNGKKVTRNAGDTIGKSDIIPADTTLKVIATAKKGSGYTGTISATYSLYSVGTIFRWIFG